ncbi:MAG TPA: hypothetical protein VIF62_16655, partial [Labilithrix sp.]
MDDLLDATRSATRDLAELVREASALWPKVSAALDATRADVERRLRCEEPAVLVTGPARRALVNAAFARELVAEGAPDPPGGTLFFRKASEGDFVARLEGGRVVDLASIVADRTESFRKSFARAEESARESAARVAEIERRLAELRAAGVASVRATAVTIPAREASSLRRMRIAWHALFDRIAAFVLSLFRTRPALPAPRSAARAMEIVTLERELLDAEPAERRAKEDLARIRDERDRWLAERRARFAVEVRALTNGESRGADVVELDVAAPSDILPGAMKLVLAPALDAPSETQRETAAKRLRDGVVGCIVAGGPPVAPPFLERLGVKPLVAADAIKGALPSLLERILRDAPAFAAAMAIADVRARLQSLAEAAAKAEAECRERIVALEAAKLPDPASFRAEQIARTSALTSEAARAVLERAGTLLHDRLDATLADWASSIDACRDRASVVRALGAIDAEAPARLAAIVDDVGETLARDTQEASESLQTQALEALRLRYKSRRAHHDPAAAVISEVAADVASPGRAPLARVVRSFDLRRIGIGIVGAALFAALGTLLLPGIGTAIGALLG